MVDTTTQYLIPVKWFQFRHSTGADEEVFLAGALLGMGGHRLPQRVIVSGELKSAGQRVPGGGEREGMGGLRSRGSPVVWHHGGLEYRRIRPCGFGTTHYVWSSLKSRDEINRVKVANSCSWSAEQGNI